MKFTSKQIKLIEFLWINYKTFTLKELLDDGYGLRHLHSVVDPLTEANILWPTSIKDQYEFNPDAKDDHIYQFLGIHLDVEKTLFLTNSKSNHTEYVYVYYYQTYKSNAYMNDITIYPCKIGSTTRGLPLLRCVEQLNTSTPETPTIALLVKCENAERIERALHGNLKANNRHLKHFFNQEWFLTNPSEVERFLSNMLINDA